MNRKRRSAWTGISTPAVGKAEAPPTITSWNLISSAGGGGGSIARLMRPVTRASRLVRPWMCRNWFRRFWISNAAVRWSTLRSPATGTEALAFVFVPAADSCSARARSSALIAPSISPAPASIAPWFSCTRATLVGWANSWYKRAASVKRSVARAVWPWLARTTARFSTAAARNERFSPTTSMTSLRRDSARSNSPARARSTAALIRAPGSSRPIGVNAVTPRWLNVTSGGFDVTTSIGPGFGGKGTGWNRLMRPTTSVSSPSKIPGFTGKTKPPPPLGASASSSA